jgi:hypothetical protein
MKTSAARIPRSPLRARRRWSPAPAAALLLLLAAAVAWPRGAEAKVRVAVPDFHVEGDRTPALALQLQDGFMLGLVRAGLQVIDPMDVARRLEGHPELASCDSSPCLRNVGELLAVKYVLRVKVDVAGNGYKMVARLFSTEGATPAALPISTKSRSCDVCTVAEARDYMLKLADAIRPDIDEPAPVVVALPPAPPPPMPSVAGPLAAAMAGALTVGLGIALLATLPSCHPAGQPSGCDDNRVRSAFGGGLIGAGAATAVVGTAVTLGRIQTIAPGPRHAASAGSTLTLALTVPF